MGLNIILVSIVGACESHTASDGGLHSITKSPPSMINS